jgi:hypothetical protein
MRHRTQLSRDLNDNFGGPLLYSYVAVLVATLSVNGFFVLAASLLFASVLSYLSYNYFLAARRTRSAGLP